MKNNNVVTQRLHQLIQIENMSIEDSFELENSLDEFDRMEENNYLITREN
ncbi:MAG: hypothetical protein ACJAZ2_000055 [Glaciecola sp.]|jgi:hypothetical protein